MRIVRAKSPRRESRGQEIVRRLRGSATVPLSTDEILAMTRGYDDDDWEDDDTG